MKRFLTTFTAVLLAVVLCCAVGFAAEAPVSHYVEEMDAEIALPAWEDHYFLYPNMPEDNPDLAYLEMTPEEIDAILVPSGILLDVMYYDLSYEVVVQVMEDDMSSQVFNYWELSEAEREAIAAASESVYSEMDIELTAIEWVGADNAVWMVVEYEMSGDLWCYQYNTVYNGKTLSLTASLYMTDSSLEAMKGDIRSVTAMMATGTVFRHTDPTPEGKGSLTGDLIGDVTGGMDLSGLDLEALAEALGLTIDEMMRLAQGEADLTILDLDKVDLAALVKALGMTEAEFFELLEAEIGINGVDLSVFTLDEIDLGALVDALGLTEEEVFALVQSEMDPSELDLSGIDPAAVLDALGLTVVEAAELALAFAGMGGVDVGGTLSSIGRGALIGCGVGVGVVVIIIILLAVTGRKKRSKKQAEPVAVESAPEE